jgi:ABC-2 type transport system ATP-binding protein
MKPVLLARHISYGNADRPRLRDFDLQLQPGDRLGLLGINGAGKSTLMQVLAGILAPSKGEVEILGQRLARVGPALRRHIGFLPQRLPVYPELTVHENLAWAGRLRGLKGEPLAAAIETVLQQVQLSEFSARLAGRLSAGMAQRLGLAQAIVHRPRILILDEPTAGLDPLQTEQIRELLGGLAAETSVILATHLLDDVQQLCNRVILLDAGQKKAEHEVTPDIDLLTHFREHAGGGRLGAAS